MSRALPRAYRDKVERRRQLVLEVLTKTGRREEDRTWLHGVFRRSVRAVAPKGSWRQFELDLQRLLEVDIPALLEATAGRKDDKGIVHG